MMEIRAAGTTIQFGNLSGTDGIGDAGGTVAVLAHEGTLEILYRDFPLPTGARFTDGYLARPDRAGEFPVVIVLPPLNGIRPWVKDLARRLARNGYSAMVCDLTRGRHPGPDGSREEMFASYREVEAHRARTDIDDALSFARNDPAQWAAPGRIGLIGLDVGGRFAISYAAHRPELVAALCAAYAPLGDDETRRLRMSEALGMLPMAVLGLYGSEDELIPAGEVDRAQELNRHGQWILYEGAGRDFLDDDSDDYHAGAAGDAGARILSLLDANLG